MVATLKSVELPDFGLPEVRPELSSDTYADRFARFRRGLKADGVDVAIVYADREHSANLSYLTGFDPRFEEAVLIVREIGEPLILVGNECVGMAEAAPLSMRVELHQELSLPGQPRDASRSLGEIFASEGIGKGVHAGTIGWKESSDSSSIEIPAYIVDALRDAVGSAGSVRNIGSLMTNPTDGLRTINEADQLAAFEYAASRTSTGVKNLLFGLRPGIREDEAVQLLGWDGSPLSCHLMLTSGDRATLGLLSPSDRRIERGDRFTTAFGTWGALNCRAGFVVEDASELPSEISDYLDKLVAPYFETIAEWYEALHIGQTGGTLFQIVADRLGDAFFGIFLNPGHLIHLDEWVNSPVYEGSNVELRSGMALQVDVIPATGTEYFTTNIEDGIALADESLRAELTAKYPDMMDRCARRQEFMRYELGIRLSPEVLPFSNIPAYLPPFLLRPDRVMAITA